MSDENLDPDDVPTKPLPVNSEATTAPIDADLTSTAPITASPATYAPPRKPTWIAPAVIIGAFALLLVLAVVILPSLVADRVDPTPSVTPTLAEEAPEETPEEPAPPVVVDPVPLPTEVLPEPTEPPTEPTPTP